MKVRRRLPSVKAARRNTRNYMDDEVFFHKRQIAIGVVLNYVGRSEAGASWRVRAIATCQNGKWVHVKVGTRLTDRVTLQRVGSTEMREMSLSYLSYSAIWRVGIPV